jgi:D-alanyl-D-alanine carboxypeptidase
VADRSTGGRPDLRDHTRIGSVTKTFTGTLILQLVDEGRLRLDDTIERWFPTLPDANRITIRQLGEMSSGIQSYTTDPTVVDRYLTHPETVWTTPELIASGTSLPRAFAPGQGFLYSNTEARRPATGHVIEGRPDGGPRCAAAQALAGAPARASWTPSVVSGRPPMVS